MVDSKRRYEVLGGENKICVTGASGFLGGAIAGGLVFGAINHHVRCISGEGWSPELEELRKAGCKVIPSDLLDPEQCYDAVKGCDIVFHCAAVTSGAKTMVEDPMSQVTPNVIMNANMLRACHLAGVKHFVFMSSAAAYPDEGGGLLNVFWKEDDMFAGDPSPVYHAVGWMKRYSEILCETYSMKTGMTTTIIRPSNVYGPGDKYDPERSHVMASLIRRVAEKQDPFVVWGDGREVRDFIFIVDFVDGVLRAVTRDGGSGTHGVYNICSGVATDVATVVKALLKVSGYSPSKLSFDETKPSTVPARRVSGARAGELLGFTAKTSLSSGISHSLEHLLGTKP